MQVIFQVYRTFFNVCTKKKEVPESTSDRCSFAILPLVKKGNIGQKLDNQYPKNGKYEVVLKFSKILNQV